MDQNLRPQYQRKPAPPVGVLAMLHALVAAAMSGEIRPLATPGQGNGHHKNTRGAFGKCRGSRRASQALKRIRDLMPA